VQESKGLQGGSRNKAGVLQKGEKPHTKNSLSLSVLNKYFIFADALKIK
jgi:hypothetical protein